MNINNYQLKLEGATWIDVNTSYGLDNLPDRLPNQLAIINCSLFNLLNCSPGQRGRTFQPTYGSQWLRFIQEPILDVTAAKMRSLMLDSIERWVPQILLDQQACLIQPDTSLPGYRVRIAFSTPFANDPQQVKFEVSV